MQSGIVFLFISPSVSFAFQAVQEFTEQISGLPDDVVKSILPYWPRIYNKIATDHDRRVREAVQKALLAGKEPVFFRTEFGLVNPRPFLFSRPQSWPELGSASQVPGPDLVSVSGRSACSGGLRRSEVFLRGLPVGDQAERGDRVLPERNPRPHRRQLSLPNSRNA